MATDRPDWPAVKEPAKKIAVFRNAYGETKSVDLTNALHFIVERPVRWFDWFLNLTVFRNEEMCDCQCMFCGRRIWFTKLGCPKPRCVAGRRDLRRYLSGFGDAEFEEISGLDECETWEVDQERGG